MNEARERDWGAIHRRLEAAERALNVGIERTPEELDRIYRKRAEDLARPIADAGNSQSESILVFRAANVRLGLPLKEIAEVIPHPKIARVPGAPAEIAGLIQVRGEVRAVWDLTALLGLNSQEAVPGDAARILLLRHAGQEIGVLAEAIEDIADYDLQRIQRSSGNLPGSRMTDDYVTVLDVQTLFARFQGSTTL